MGIGERIKKRRKQIGMSAETLAEKLDLAPSTIYRYESGEIGKVATELLMKIAEELRTTPGWLMGWTENSEQTGKKPLPEMQMKRIPILGDTAAGAPIIATREYDEYIEVPVDGRRFDAAVRVTGDSMEPGYRIGDLALIRYMPDVLDGQISVVFLDDEVTLKRVYHGNGFIDLLSDNPKYRPMHIDADDYDSVTILGRAVGCIRWEAE